MYEFIIIIIIMLLFLNYVDVNKIFIEFIASNKMMTKFNIISDLRKFWL